MDTQSALAQIGEALEYLRGVLTPTPAQPPATTAPTAPVLGSTSVASNVITVPVSTPSTHADGISGYQVWRGTSSGGEAYIGDTATVPYVTPGLAAGTYYFKFKGIAVSGTQNVSAFSNEVSATISGALGADHTAPLASVQPTVESGTGATLATVVWITPPADSTVNSGTEVVSGADYVRWYQDGTTDAAKNSYYPATTAEVLEDIGTHKSGTGTDDGSTLTSVDFTSGDGIYGTEDAGFTFKRGGTKGKVTLFIKPTSATSSAYWGKPIGLMVRATNDPQSAYLNVFLFASGGAKAIGTEWRDTNGAQASQATAVSYTTMPWLKLVYDPDTDIAVTSYSTNSTNGTDGTWTTHATHTIAAIGTNYLSGKFGTSGGTAAYTNYSRTVDTKVRYAFTGRQTVGSTTTINIDHDAVDKAGNANARGTARACTYDALADSGGGGGGISNGAAGNYPLTAAICIGNGSHDGAWFHDVARNIDAFTYFPDGNVSNEDAIFASIRSDNPTVKLCLYVESIFLYSFTWNSLIQWATNNNFLLRDSYPSGALTVTGGYVLNAFDDPASGPTRITDTNGRTSNEWIAAWLYDLAVAGGSLGIAYDVPGTRTVPDVVYLDDLMAYDQTPGDFTRGAGGDQSAAIQAGTIRRVQVFGQRFGKPIGGNTAWGGNVGARSVPSSFNGLLKLKTMEAFDNTELYTSPGASVLAAMKNEYKAGEALTASDGDLWLCTQGVQHNGSDPIRHDGGTYGNSAADEGANYWAAVAYTWGRARISMTQGDYYRPEDAVFARIYSINTTTGLPYAQASWSSGRGWMGKAVGAAQIDTPQGNGTYAREFEHAWVILNPHGNGSQSFTTPVNVRKAITGTYYAAGSSVPLADRSGTFLVKA